MGEDEPPPTIGGGGGGTTIPIRRGIGGGEFEAEGPDVEAEELATLHGRISDLEDQLADQALTISRLTVRATEAENDLERAKSRIAREARKDAKRQRHDLLRSLLEVVDNFDRALEAHTDNMGELARGVRLVRQHFLKVLGEHGVTSMESEGKSFSPDFHEAISTMPTTDPRADGKVAQVAQSGYLVGDEVLRPARVVVAKLSS